MIVLIQTLLVKLQTGKNQNLCYNGSTNLTNVKEQKALQS